ncbi:hypothetical protein J3R30DRAFT_3301570 [Lentinula aciculospora]|uniref:MYND-type domain-containing protein n=1 Tax=Lentinula aciculospora TaxID=153920 RepID=A0A9W8ZYI0_9AGAR|nr:hypothetical protein J3R30DRAFT_3301570 [Lentinula aciculospora]
MGRIQRQRSSDDHSFLVSQSTHPERLPQVLSLENLMSFRLGSGPYGEPIRHLLCANQSTRPRAQKRCPGQGLISCPRCQLVKYCSERCQKQHWPRHSSTCAHPYLEENWQPGWVSQERPPSFACSSATFSPSSFIFPAFDTLNLAQNEGENATNKDYKLCFAACADIRNLVETVNNLPSNYQGKFDILINNSDPIIINRNLVILYALLNPEPSIDEAAELALHLMYSAVLNASGAAYLQRCLDDIYGSQFDSHNGDFSFRISLNTRGEGKIRSLQTVAGVKQPLETFTATVYGLAVALKNRWTVLDAPENGDSWDRFLSRLRPSHRMAFKRFRETGVLAPFSVDTSSFMHPNRLMFSSQGEWLCKSDFNPLQGWNATSVQVSGAKLALIESADIFGCLFFYLKSQFRQFASQVKNHNINFVLTQFDPQILAKGISTGVIPIFEGACFDRVDTRDMMDDVGIEVCLADWGPLLNRENCFASLLMHSRAWHYDRPHALARCNPQAALMMFMHKCFEIPSLNIKLKDVFTQGLRSPALLRLVESLDAFYDHDDILREFLEAENTGPAAASFDLRLRPLHRVHPKRFGVPLDACDHQLPDISKSQFYDLGECKM